MSFFEIKKGTPSDGDEPVDFYRWFFVPFLIVWLHNFEVLSYGGGTDGPINYFLLPLSSIICLQVYVLTKRTGPKWQIYLYNTVIFLVGINIILGFFNKYSESKGTWFTKKDELNIRKLDKTLLQGLKLLDTTRAFVVGKYEKRLRPLSAYSRIKRDELTSDQQNVIFENQLLPKDFRLYWNLIDTTGNNISEQLIADYYDWQFPDYNIYICIPSLACNNPYFYNANNERLINCYTTYGGKGRIRHFESIGYIFKSSGGWPMLKDRFHKYYKAIEESFFPTYVRRDLMNDPYFLIERGKYKKAREGLTALPPKRKAFCEAKLKALGK